MKVGDQFRFDPSLFSLNAPNYRDVFRCVSPTTEVCLSEGALVVGVDEENSIISAIYNDGTKLIRNPDLRGGHVVLVASPDGNFWYMNSPDCWLRLD